MYAPAALRSEHQNPPSLQTGSHVKASVVSMLITTPKGSRTHRNLQVPSEVPDQVVEEALS